MSKQDGRYVVRYCKTPNFSVCQTDDISTARINRIMFSLSLPRLDVEIYDSASGGIDVSDTTAEEYATAVNGYIGAIRSTDDL